MITHMGVSFVNKDLSHRVLDGNYIDCDFTDANLERAKLVGVFIHTLFRRTKMDGADLSLGKFTLCLFEEVNLQSARVRSEYLARHNTLEEDVLLPDGSS